MHLEAFCKDNNIPFYNPTLANMISPYKCSNEFNFFKGYFLSIIFKMIAILYKLTKKLKIIKLIDFNNEDNVPEYKEILKKKNNCFVIGWCFRDYENLVKNKDFFKEKFALKEKIDDNISTLLSKDIIKLGIHIRRGNYKKWENGKYYFDDTVYIKVIKRMISLLNKPVYLFIFSNEIVNKELYFNEFGTNIYFSKNEYFIDHFIMSNCDYLIGPPSTFTAYASLIGKAQYYHIHNINKEFSLGDFTHSIG